MPSVDEALARARARIDARAREALAALEGPEALLAAMRHAVLPGGKRIRPCVLLESAGLFGEAGADALEAALALEFVHCYSLVHDDLPAMDDDSERRGQPAVHVLFGEADAILAGNALLAEAFARLADPDRIADASARAELAGLLARAAGTGGLAGGQVLDLAGPAPEELPGVRAMKTGALFRFAAEAGAVLGRADGESRAALAAYGADLGMLFQVVDDLLDGGVACPEEAAREADALARAAAGRLERFGARGGVLAGIVRFARERAG